MKLGYLATAMVASLTLYVDSSGADIVTYDWRVTNLFVEYDGVFVPSLGINDQTGDQAVIEVELGQEVEIRVTNELQMPTCLHWHGLKQLGTQEMDGTSGITQCHIDPNDTATYRFKPDKAGTFWWHSHHKTEYVFGLRGPLIVCNPKHQKKRWEKEIDGEFIVQLADHYHRQPNGIPMWDNILINNRGRYNCTAALHHNFTQCTDDQPLSKFNFKAGKKYRLRLINMAALSPIVFSIDDHEFQVVATDGDYVQPSALVNSVLINVGQRYDIIVETKSSSEGNPIGSFWMRANGLYGDPWTKGTATDAGEGFTYEGLAIVSYDSKSTEPTTTQPANLTSVGEFDFKPLVPIALPEKPFDRAIFQVGLQQGIGQVSIDGGNFTQFIEPDEPPLFTISSGLTTEQLPASANARKIEYGKHIEIVLVNINDEQHPFHMHSHSPWVVGSGTASLDQIRNNQLPPLKLLNPMTRDVYTVPPCTSDGKGGCLDFGYLVIRLNADSPGVWIFHCHIDWHLNTGLAMIIVEGEMELQKKGVESYSNSVLSVCGKNSTFFNAPTQSTRH